MDTLFSMALQCQVKDAFSATQDKSEAIKVQALRGSVPKNGPIDFASKNHFSLNSADGKGLIPKY